MPKVSFELWIVVIGLFFAGQKAMAQNFVHNKEGLILPDSTLTGRILNDSIDAGSLPTDSVFLKTDTVANKNKLDAPVNMTAKDSMIMVMEGGNKLLLYGSASVKYKEITLDAEFIQMDADSSILYASYGVDSLGAKFGFPSFKDNSQQTEMEQVWYNFDTKKMFTRNVITTQGEGFITAAVAKRMPDESFYIENGRYTTCDLHEHPHFYFNLTKAKIQPGKKVITGPAYLVIEDVPLPFAIPFGFFPSSSSYSSGILMPSYNDEMARGFSLRDAGYYFAFSDNVDLALTGEIYTKGSWGLSAHSNYIKRYKFQGNFDASYLVTVMGDKDSKNLPNSDYSVSRDIRVNWSHRQDPKSNPYGSFSANVQFATSSFSRNNFRTETANQMTENTKASSVSYSYRHPTIPLSINTSSSINQRSKDSTLTVSLPEMTLSLSSVYPFKRKEQVGSDRWYEKIYFSYSGVIRNNINDVKEYQFFKKNLMKDWRNGMKHSIPVSASFNIFKYISISASFNYNENWYTNQTRWGYDLQQKRVVPVDTTYGFFRTFEYNGGISLNTKLYGTYKPWALLGKWTKGVQIRHVLTPAVSFSGAPDFSDPKLGMYKDIYYLDPVLGQQVIRQPIYQNALFGGPGKGRTGSANFSLDNNLEMKMPIAGTDSSRKISLIDNLGLRMSYNFLADSLNWSNLNASIRLKVLGTNIQLSGVFDTYLYDENAHHINIPRWKAGKGIGRFMGISQSFSPSISNETFKNLFKKGDGDSAKKGGANPPPDGQEEGDENGEEGGGNNSSSSKTSLFKTQKQEGDYDANGYLIYSVPWNLSFSYSVNWGYDMQHFDKVKREYPYKISQTLGLSGSISPTKSWKFSFSSSYDFDFKKIAYMNCSISREMHCWQMSASVVPFGPYQNYSFTIAIKSTLLQDVKYQQSSSYRDALNWGN